MDDGSLLRSMNTRWWFVCLCMISQYPMGVSGEPNQDICIIGSGIAGSMSAYFVREYAGPDVRIHVYEKDLQIGGRVSGFRDSNGTFIEAGGSVMHRDNRYIMTLARYLGLDIQPASEGDKRMSIFNGQEFVFESTGWSWIDKATLVWRYGYFHLTQLTNFVDEMMDKFNQVYLLQDSGRAYASPEELLRQVGLYDLTQTTLEKVLLQRNVSQLLIDEFATAINRVNYGQDSASVNAFAGVVGLAGSGDKLRVIRGGNVQLVEKCLQHSQSHVRLNTRVNKIVKKTHQYELQLAKEVQGCDAVIIATPLEVAHLDIPDIVPSGNVAPNRVFQLTQTTFVQGQLRPEIFRARTTTTLLPDIVLTTENQTVFFSSIGRIHRNESAVNTGLYKIFSRKKITPKELDELFITSEIVRVFPWRAYPKFRPPEQFSNFELHQGLIYVNAIENAASAMEMSALGARNAALLLKKYFQWTYQSSAVMNFSSSEGASEIQDDPQVRQDDL